MPRPRRWHHESRRSSAPTAFENIIICDNWCAIRYTVKIKNLHTGEEITQNTMEFVTFKENPEPVGVRVVGGWALSDSPLSAK